MRTLSAAVLGLALVSCGAPSAGAPRARVAPPATETEAAAAPLPRIDATCPSDLVVLERTPDAVTYLAQGRHRLRVHADGTVETGAPLPSAALGVALVEGHWLFACSGGAIVRAPSSLGELAAVGRFDPDPHDLGRDLVVQRGALGTFATADGVLGPVRIDGEGAVTPLAIPPVTRVVFESAEAAVLVFVGGGLGRLDPGGRASGVVLGDGDRVAAIAIADDGAAVVLGAGGTLSREVERVPCDPDGRAAAALIAAREAEQRATPALTAGLRDVFVDDGGDAPDTLRILSHEGHAELARVALPAASCTPDALGDAIVALCDAGDDGVDLFLLDADGRWSAIARAVEITSEWGASPLGYRELLPSGTRDCFVVASGRLTCFADGEGPVLLGTTACVVRRAHGSAVAVRSVDLVTGSALEAPIPAALRRGTWTATDDLDDGTCGARREAADGTSVLYRVVVANGGGTLVAEETEPRVIELSIACCFGRYGLDCTPSPSSRTDAPPAWTELGPDEEVAALHVGTRRVPVGPSESPDGDVLRGLVVYGDGSADATLEGGPALRTLHVGPDGAPTIDGDRRLWRGPFVLGSGVLGDSVLVVQERDDGTRLERLDRARGASIAARTLDGTGPFAVRDGAPGVAYDDVFVPLDPRDPPTRLEPVPDALADFDCRWPPPCAQSPSPHATVVYEEGGVLQGLSSVAWLGVEHDGPRTCLREVVTPYGDVLSLSDGAFVGSTVVESARADVTCSAPQ